MGRRQVSTPELTKPNEKVKLMKVQESTVISTRDMVFSATTNNREEKDDHRREEMMQERRDQYYLLNNRSRELIGQTRNMNTRQHSDYPLVINVSYTQYEVLQDCADETDFRLSTEEEEDWDVWWIDAAIIPTLLIKMKGYQRTNHLPAIYVLARKNLLARNLNMMQKALPEQFDFFP